MRANSTKGLSPEKWPFHMIDVRKYQQTRWVEILRPRLGNVELLDHFGLEVLDHKETKQNTVPVKITDAQFDELIALRRKEGKREAGKCT
jgi:hypothetical protein